MCDSYVQAVLVNSDKSLLLDTSVLSTGTI